jgi:ubiquitin carboxyl-terminal hydrolase 5/13
VLANVPFDACLQKWAAPETIADFFSSALQAKGTAEKTVRMKTFPKYLVVQLRKFFVDSDWSAKKMEVDLTDVPDELNLETFRSTGKKPEEELLPEGPSSGSGSGAVEPDATVVAMVVSMGFSENAGKRAAIATGNRSPEEAVNWVLAHMEDADLNDPPAGSASKPAAADPQQVAMLQDMGFTASQAEAALKACNMSVERAVEWLFSHADDLDAACAQAAGDAPAESAGGTHDGKGEYSLLGFISHLGKNTGCGHYVVHLKKDDQWVLFNDRKVGISENPPRGMGYLYIFKQK